MKNKSVIALIMVALVSIALLTMLRETNNNSARGVGARESHTEEEPNVNSNSISGEWSPSLRLFHELKVETSADSAAAGEWVDFTLVGTYNHNFAADSEPIIEESYRILQQEYGDSFIPDTYTIWLTLGPAYFGTILPAGFSDTEAILFIEQRPGTRLRKYPGTRLQMGSETDPEGVIWCALGPELDNAELDRRYREPEIRVRIDGDYEVLSDGIRFTLHYSPQEQGIRIPISAKFTYPGLYQPLVGTAINEPYFISTLDPIQTRFHTRSDHIIVR